jgi:hypothetical protein
MSKRDASTGHTGNNILTSLNYLHFLKKGENGLARLVITKATREKGSALKGG